MSADESKLKEATQRLRAVEAAARNQKTINSDSAKRIYANFGQTFSRIKKLEKTVRYHKERLADNTTFVALNKLQQTSKNQAKNISDNAIKIKGINNQLSNYGVEKSKDVAHTPKKKKGSPNNRQGTRPRKKRGPTT